MHQSFYTALISQHLTFFASNYRNQIECGVSSQSKVDLFQLVIYLIFESCFIFRKSFGYFYPGLVSLYKLGPEERFYKQNSCNRKRGLTKEALNHRGDAL